jgi:hypothetical protein
MFSASARISKGQGYQGFLGKRAICVIQEHNFTPFRVNKITFLKGQGACWEVKGHKGTPW